jgi:hypothetical protein
MRTTRGLVDGGRGRNYVACRGRLRSPRVGSVAAQSCCILGTLTLKCQEAGPLRTISLGMSAGIAPTSTVAGGRPRWLVREYPRDTPDDLAIGHVAGITAESQLRRSFHTGGQPPCVQVGGCSQFPWVTAGDGSFPPVLARKWHGECWSPAREAADGILGLMSSETAWQLQKSIMVNRYTYYKYAKLHNKGYHEKRRFPIPQQGSERNFRDKALGF